MNYHPTMILNHQQHQQKVCSIDIQQQISIILFLFSEIHQPNERLARLIRIYRSPLPRRPGIPPGLIQTRATGYTSGRSAPPQVTATAPTSAPPPAPVSIRPSRRISPINRPKSPSKVTRQAESPPKIIRRAESPPKRPIINDTINIERLKIARDEAERAMKVHN